MAQIECAFCGAYATKIPGPTVHFSDWESAIVVLRKGAIWGLPLDSKLKKLEEENKRLKKELRDERVGRLGELLAEDRITKKQFDNAIEELNTLAKLDRKDISVAS